MCTSGNYCLVINSKKSLLKIGKNTDFFRTKRWKEHGDFYISTKARALRQSVVF